MKRVLILSGPYQKGHSPRYSVAFSKKIKNYKFTDVEFDKLLVEISPADFKITDSVSGADIKSFDLVIVREYTGHYLDLAFVVSKYLKLNNVLFFNEIYLNYRPVSKLAQAVIFHELQIPFPATVFSIDRQLLAAAAANLEYPLIIKESQASHGDNNFLAKTKTEAATILSENSAAKLILQPYIPNDHDYRILVMNGRCQLQIERRGRLGSHLNNTSKGGRAHLTTELPQEVLQYAEKLVRHLKVDLAGVDVLQDSVSGVYYFLEINFQPQIISGAFVDEKLEKLGSMLNDQFIAEDTGS